MLKKTMKELSKHTFIYSLYWIASSAASLLLMPVYTRFLTKQEYGILELLDYTNVVISIVVMAGLNAAIPKFYNDRRSEAEGNTVLSTAGIFVVLCGTAICAIAFLFDRTLALLVLGDEDLKHLIDLNILLLYVQLFIQVCGACLIAQRRSALYSGYMLARLVSAIAANLYFVVFREMGALGMLYGNILSSCLIAVLATVHTFAQSGLDFSNGVLRPMLRFGLPLIPATLSATIMHNADRYLIRFYCTLEDVGIYSLGYKFPWMINTLLMQAFSMIWTGSMIYEISKQPDSEHQFGRIATYVLSANMAIQYCLSIFAVAIVRIFADAKYLEAHKIVPLVALGLCFHSFQFFFSIGTYVKQKTWLVNYAYLAAAAVNIVGNIVLLKRFGYMAAAWMTVVTYLLFSSILYYSCRRLVPIRYESKRIAKLFLACIALYLASALLHFDNLLLELAKGAAFVLLLAAYVYFGGWITAGEKVVLRERVLSWRNALAG